MNHAVTRRRLVTPGFRRRPGRGAADDVFSPRYLLRHVHRCIPARAGSNLFGGASETTTDSRETTKKPGPSRVGRKVPKSGQKKWTRRPLAARVFRTRENRPRRRAFLTKRANRPFARVVYAVCACTSTGKKRGPAFHPPGAADPVRRTKINNNKNRRPSLGVVPRHNPPARSATSSAARGSLNPQTG